MQLAKTECDNDLLVAYKQHWKPVSTSERKVKDCKVPSAAALNTISLRSNPSLLFCDNLSHKSTMCKESTVTMRMEKQKKLGRYFICLVPRHVAKYCKTRNVSCSICAGGHHVTLCDSSDPSEPPVAAASEASNAVVSSVVPYFAAQNEGSHGTVLLQTVRAWIEGRGRRKMVYRLVDS